MSRAMFLPGCLSASKSGTLTWLSAGIDLLWRQFQVSSSAFSHFHSGFISQPERIQPDSYKLYNKNDKCVLEIAFKGIKEKSKVSWRWRLFSENLLILCSYTMCLDSVYFIE